MSLSNLNPTLAVGELLGMSELTEAQREQVKELYKELIEFELPFTPHAADYIYEAMDVTMEEILQDIENIYIMTAMSDMSIFAFLAVDKGRPAIISALYIKEEYRRLSYGSAMLERFAVHNFFDTLSVHCFDLNESALRFYRKNGFVFEPDKERTGVLLGTRSSEMER